MKSRRQIWHRRHPATWLIAVLVATVSSVFLVAGVATGDNHVKDTAKLSSALYASAIAETYDFKFGPNPFAPSNANSTTGTFIPGEAFVPSTRCGTCHTDAHAQWRQSAHGNAFREPFYQKNVKDLQNQIFNSPDFTNPDWWTRNATTTSSRQLRSVVARGKAGMPAFGKKLSKAEINLLVERVRKFRK